MAPKSISIVVALLIITWLPIAVDAAERCETTADCTSPNECIGGACVPPVPDPDAYVTEAITRWSSYVWTVQLPSLFEPDPERCCFDYTGDGAADDAFGVLLSSVGPMINTDFQGLVNTAIVDGELVKVFDWRELTPDLISGDVQLSIFDGQWTDPAIHSDRILGHGHTAFRRTSFGPFGALDQLNDGGATSGLVEVTGNQVTLMLPWFFAGDELATLHLLEARLEAPVSYGEPLRDTCLGLCTVDEDRGPSHAPQIVGGGKLGGVITADEILTHMDNFYRQCACAGITDDPVLEWGENETTLMFEISCTSNTGNPALCDPDDPCSDLDLVCGLIGVFGGTLDVDQDGTGIADAWSIGLRLGFAGTTLDRMPELFADGFESGDVIAWSGET